MGPVGTGGGAILGRGGAGVRVAAAVAAGAERRAGGRRAGGAIGRLVRAPGKAVGTRVLSRGAIAGRLRAAGGGVTRGAVWGGLRAAGVAAFPGAAGLTERAPATSGADAGRAVPARAGVLSATVTAGRVMPGPLVRSPAGDLAAGAPRTGRRGPPALPAVGVATRRAVLATVVGAAALFEGDAVAVVGRLVPAAAVRVSGARSVFTPVLDRAAPKAAAADLLSAVIPGRTGVTLARMRLLAPAPTLWGERPRDRGFATRVVATLRMGEEAAERSDPALRAGCLRRVFAGEASAAVAGNSSSRASGSTMLRLVLISRPRARRRSTASSLVIPSRLANS
ncbi:MAG: hypothetical protein V3S71_07095 [Acidobacteriota bacterium]